MSSVHQTMWMKRQSSDAHKLVSEGQDTSMLAENQLRQLFMLISSPSLSWISCNRFYRSVELYAAIGFMPAHKLSISISEKLKACLKLYNLDLSWFLSLQYITHLRQSYFALFVKQFLSF